MPYRYESHTIARVVIGLVLLGVSAVGLIGALAWVDKPIPDALTAVGVGSMTALATLLTTFTPSPLPGGRRGSDAPIVVDETTAPPSTGLAPSGSVTPSAETRQGRSHDSN